MTIAQLCQRVWSIVSTFEHVQLTRAARDLKGQTSETSKQQCSRPLASTSRQHCSLECPALVGVPVGAPSTSPCRGTNKNIQRMHEPQQFAQSRYTPGSGCWGFRRWFPDAVQRPEVVSTLNVRPRSGYRRNYRSYKVCTAAVSRELALKPFTY